SNIELTPAGTTFSAELGNTSYSIRCNLPGEFNVYNTLAAVGIGRAAGLTKEQIETSIAGLPGVEGRMNRIDEGQDFDVIIDYAPTPDGFIKVFDAVKSMVKGRILVVFGSAGRRDELKRPIQGEIAGK